MIHWAWLIVAAVVSGGVGVFIMGLISSSKISELDYQYSKQLEELKKGNK